MTNYTTVTGNFQNVLGEPVEDQQFEGTWTVTFTPSTLLVDVADSAFIAPIPIVVPLDQGEFSISLMSTDNTNLVDSNGLSGGWSYSISVNLGNIFTGSASFALPYSASAVDITALVNFATMSPVAGLSSGISAMAALSGANIWTGTQNFEASPPFIIASGAQAGYVLTSDANGNVSWQQPSGSTSGVSSINGQTGAITLGSAAFNNTGDFMVASPVTLTASGLGSATSASRYAGATTVGAPTTGTFVVGDWIIDRTGAVRICTTAGSPGTWTLIPHGNANVANILPSPGTASTGSSGQSADSGHVHGQPPMFAPTGLTGATAVSRYVGATASGAPVSGTFAVGDWVVDQGGGIWVCITLGTPGSWVKLGARNNLAANIQPSPGTQAQGTNGTVSDSGHVHGQPPVFAPTGLTGAVAASRYVGGTVSGAPVTGSFVAGDFVTDQNGRMWLCTSAGSPGTWTQAAGGTLTSYLAPAVVALTFGASIAVNAAFGNAFSLTLTASTGTLANPTNPVDGQVIRIRVTQGTGGSFTLAYGTAYDFGSGSAPTLSTAAGKVDILGFEYVASISKWCYLGSGLGF